MAVARDADRRRRSRLRNLLAPSVVVVALAACGGSSKPAASSSSSAPPTTTATSAPSTTAAVTGQRGLSAVVSAIVGNGKDDGKGIPGPATDASLGDKVHYAVASNGDIFMIVGSVDVLKVSGGQVTKFGLLDPSAQGFGGIAVASDGTVFVATTSTVVKFDANGTRSDVLDAKTAGLSTGLGPIALDSAGNVYVADGLRRVTRVAPDGQTSLIAGTGVQAKPDTAEGDGGPATASPLGAPAQLAVDSVGNLYIADTSALRVRRVTPDGTITTIAGGGTTVLNASGAFAPDGTKPTDLKLSQVTGVAVDSKGRVYVADAGMDAIFRFGTTGGIEFLMGDQKGGSESDGLPANATRLTNASDLEIDAQKNLVFLEARVIYRI
ncbi:MAG: trimeric autotransporter adhesin, partial [Acidimicrobiaceae bacterium]